MVALVALGFSGGSGSSGCGGWLWVVQSWWWGLCSVGLVGLAHVAPVELFGWIQGIRSVWLDYGMELVTWLGTGWVGIPLGVYLVWRGWWRELVMFLLGGLVLFLVVKGLKVGLGVLRPVAVLGEGVLVERYPWSVPYRFESFPSGHSATAVFLSVWYLWLWFRGCVGRWGGWVLVLVLVLALLACLSRIYLFQHYPVDVVGGIWGGWVVGTVFMWLSCCWGRRGSEKV